MNSRSSAAVPFGLSPVVSTPSKGLVPREPRPDLRAYDSPRLASLEPGGHRARFGDGPADSPLVFFLLLFSGWVNRHQQTVIDYLLEENRVLRATQGPRRLCLTDDQRRRLAVKGKVLGRRCLADIAGMVTPDTIRRWYRRRAATMLSKRLPFP
jgi:hypothetical protein